MTTTKRLDYAHSLVEKGNSNARPSGFFSFFKEPEWEDAAKNYCDAANIYKGEKNFDLAGFFYRKATTCYQNVKDKYHTILCANNAAECYCDTNFNLSIELWTTATHASIDDGNYANAGNYTQKIAETLEQKKEISKTIEYYIKAADYHLMGNFSTRYRKCLEKAADLLTSTKKYTEAIVLYKKTLADNDVSKYMGDRNKIKIFLCLLATADSVASENYLEKMIEDKYITSEYKFLYSINDAFNKLDLQDYNQILQEYTNIKQLSQIEIALLTDIKDILIEMLESV